MAFKFHANKCYEFSKLMSTRVIYQKKKSESTPLSLLTKPLSSQIPVSLNHKLHSFVWGSGFHISFNANSKYFGNSPIFWMFHALNLLQVKRDYYGIMVRYFCTLALFDYVSCFVQLSVCIVILMFVRPLSP